MLRNACYGKTCVGNAFFCIWVWRNTTNWASLQKKSDNFLPTKQTRILCPAFKGTVFSVFPYCADLQIEHLWSGHSEWHLSWCGELVRDLAAYNACKAEAKGRRCNCKAETYKNRIPHDHHIPSYELYLFASYALRNAFWAEPDLIYRSSRILRYFPWLLLHSRRLSLSWEHYQSTSPLLSFHFLLCWCKTNPLCFLQAQDRKTSVQALCPFFLFVLRH